MLILEYRMTFEKKVDFMSRDDVLIHLLMHAYVGLFSYRYQLLHEGTITSKMGRTTHSGVNLRYKL